MKYNDANKILVFQSEKDTWDRCKVDTDFHGSQEQETRLPKLSQSSEYNLK